MHAPFTRCMPGPHASLTLTIESFGVCSGARGIATADDAKTIASKPIVHLIIVPSCSNDNAFFF